jgi:hypothetical protein
VTFSDIGPFCVKLYTRDILPAELGPFLSVMKVMIPDVTVHCYCADAEGKSSGSTNRSVQACLAFDEKGKFKLLYMLECNFHAICGN